MSNQRPSPRVSWLLLLPELRMAILKLIQLPYKRINGNIEEQVRRRSVYAAMPPEW